MKTKKKKNKLNRKKIEKSKIRKTKKKKMRKLKEGSKDLLAAHANTCKLRKTNSRAIKCI